MVARGDRPLIFQDSHQTVDPIWPPKVPSTFITVRKRSCKKVMFSQACVKNSVHSGGCTPSLGRHPLPWGVSALGSICPGRCLPGAVSVPGEGCVYPSMQWGRHPPYEQNDRQVEKHYLAATTLRTVMTSIRALCRGNTVMYNN